MDGAPGRPTFNRILAEFLIEVSGVRSSCETMEMKSDFIWSTVSNWVCAFSTRSMRVSLRLKTMKKIITRTQTRKVIMMLRSR